MGKEDVVSMYNSILLNHGKEPDLVIHDNMDGSKGYYARSDKSEKENVWFHLHTESEKKEQI